MIELKISTEVKIKLKDFKSDDISLMVKNGIGLFYEAYSGIRRMLMFNTGATEDLECIIDQPLLNFLIKCEFTNIVQSDKIIFKYNKLTLELMKMITEYPKFPEGDLLEINPSDMLVDLGRVKSLVPAIIYDDDGFYCADGNIRIYSKRDYTNIVKGQPFGLDLKSLTQLLKTNENTKIFHNREHLWSVEQTGKFKYITIINKVNIKYTNCIKLCEGKKESEEVKIYEYDIVELRTLLLNIKKADSVCLKDNSLVVKSQRASYKILTQTYCDESIFLDYEQLHDIVSTLQPGILKLHLLQAHVMLTDTRDVTYVLRRLYH